MSAPMEAEIETECRVYKGFRYFDRSLRDFVAKHMSARRGVDWQDFAWRQTPDADRETPLDTYELLRTIIKKENWEEVFKPLLFNKRQQRNTLNLAIGALSIADEARKEWPELPELQIAEEARHRLSHGSIHHDDAVVYLHTMYKLMEAVKADEQSIQQLKRLLREQFLPLTAGLPSTLGASSVKKNHEDDLYADRVRDPDCYDLLEIWRIHTNEFPEREIADSYPSFKRWISEIDENRLPADHELDDIMLVLKLQDRVVGYLYAQHYIERNLVFVSYIATDSTVPGIYCLGVKKLFEKLIEICESRRNTWQAILGEVEQIKGTDAQHDTHLFHVFKTHIKELKYLSPMPSGLFIIDFDYVQPIIRPEDLNSDRSSVKGVNQRLLYFARNINSLQKDARGQYMLDSEEALNVFDTLFSCVYGDAYPEDDRYQGYLQGVLESHKPDLARGLRPIDLTRAAAQPGERTKSR